MEPGEEHSSYINRLKTHKNKRKASRPVPYNRPELNGDENKENVPSPSTNFKKARSIFQQQPAANTTVYNKPVNYLSNNNNNTINNVINNNNNSVLSNNNNNCLSMGNNMNPAMTGNSGILKKLNGKIGNSNGGDSLLAKRMKDVEGRLNQTIKSFNLFSNSLFKQIEQFKNDFQSAATEIQLIKSQISK